MRHSPVRSGPVRLQRQPRPERLGLLRVMAMTLTLIGAVLLIGCSEVSDRSAAPDPSPTSSRPVDSPPEAGAGPVVAVVGDSYTTGSDMDSGPASNWSALMADELRRDHPGAIVHVEAGGGSGYTTSGVRGLDFEAMARLSMPSDPDLIIVFGSLNDSRSAASTVSDAARSLMDWLQAEHPDTTMLVIGPPWMDESVPANLLLVRDAVRSVALDAGATFIDPVADGWFDRESASLIGRDGVHPTDAGQRHLAELITPMVERLLAARPTP